MTIFLTLLARYWKPLAILALIAGFYGYAHHAGYASANAHCLAAQAKQEAAYQKAIAAEQARADKINQQLQDALNAPPAAPIIREVVHANPSRCDIPKPVADSLRHAISEANKGAAAR